VLSDHDLEDPLIHELITWRKHEPERFRQEVLSNTLWIGAGSICDLYLPEIRPGDERTREDQRRLRSALMRLAQALEAEGIADERTLGWADTFREWSEQGF
jgi:hypothetical protein